MKIYTKKGDSGITGLYGGRRVSKDELRIEAYGSLDELNSHLGILATIDSPCISGELFSEIQSALFDMGSWLAADPDKELKLPELKASSIRRLEKEIDRLEEGLPSLRYFILPGGTRDSAHCHVARSVCRRAERRIVALHNRDTVDLLILKYINRLSDYLFVLARKLVHEQGGEEVPWIPQK